MENASKAMIMVASLIIAVMILSIMVYLFVQAGRVPAQFEYTKQAEDVAAFNSKFEKYIIKSDINNNGNVEGDELNALSNSFADVISACNLAYDINCRSENDKYNSVRIDIDINGDEYCVFPIEDGNEESILEKGKVFECNTTQKSQMTKENMVDLYSLMETADSHGVKLNDMQYDSENKLRYKYYFDCEADYGFSEDTNTFENGGKIMTLKFKLVTNSSYSSP